MINCYFLLLVKRLSTGSELYLSTKLYKLFKSFDSANCIDFFSGELIDYNV